MIPTTTRAHHSGRRFMLVRGIGVLPGAVPELTRDVGSRARAPSAWSFWPCDAAANKCRWPERNGVLL